MHVPVLWARELPGAVKFQSSVQKAVGPADRSSALSSPHESQPTDEDQCGRQLWCQLFFPGSSGLDSLPSLPPPIPPIPYPPFPSQQDDIHPSSSILSAGMSLRLSAALFAQCKELRLAAWCNRFHLEPVILLFGLVPLGFPEGRVRETRWDSSRLYQIIKRGLALITPATGYSGTDTAGGQALQPARVNPL